MSIRRSNTVEVEETINNLRRLFQVVNKQSKSVASETGLSGPQLWAIKVLSEESGNSITVSRLAELMCLNSSTVVRIIDALEARSMVQRVRSVSDRRIVYVTLTDNGSSVVHRAPNVAQNILTNSLKALSENKLHIIATGLSQLVNILDSQIVSAQRMHVSKNI